MLECYINFLISKVICKFKCFKMFINKNVMINWECVYCDIYIESC